MTAVAVAAAPRRAPTVLEFLFRYPQVSLPTPKPKRIVRASTGARKLWFGRPWGDLERDTGEPAIVLATSATLARVLSPVTLKKAVKPKLGIDLAVRGIEVRKLFYAAFARGLARDGYDPEDALQEVYRGLLARNNGTCPFDARKSSFGHYVHIVTKCVLANWIRKERRRGSFESNETTLTRFTSEESGRAYRIEDEGPWRYSLAPSETDIQRLSREMGADARTEKAIRLLIDGHSRKEVLGRLGVEPKWLEGVLAGARGVLQS